MEITKRKDKLPIIETARLLLRDIRVKDISDNYLAWINDPETTQYLEIRFEPQTRTKVEAFIQSRVENVKNVKHFGIYDDNGSRLIGNVTANINARHKSADISYIIGHPDAMGKGYATEAVHAVVYYLFHLAGMEQLWAGYYQSHTASAKVLAKNGFTVQGCVKKQLLNHKGEREDKIYVGLLPDDFTPNPELIGPLPTVPRTTES